MTTTDERRKAGATLAAMLAELNNYSRFGEAECMTVRVYLVDGSVMLELDGALMETPVDPWGVQYRALTDAITLDDAFIALSHKLAGTEEAPADWGKRWLYNWANAPTEATHAATDANSRAFWYASEPQIGEKSETWLPRAGLPRAGRKALLAEIDKGDILYRADWRQSLEARPAGLDNKNANGHL